MLPTGIVRQVDKLGRIVLPISLRRLLEINEADRVEIFTEDHAVYLKKYAPFCVFCGEVRDVRQFGGQVVCPACARELKTLFKK